MGVTPCYDQAVYEDSGKLVRMDYRFYFPECPEAADILAFLPNDPEVAEKRATVYETFKKYRPYRNMGEVEFNQMFNVDAFTAAKQADTVDYNTYCEKVTDQALRMNKHNQLRVDMEKEDAIYRTYTILKHFILCAGGKATLDTATPEVLIQAAKDKFNCTNGHKNLYKKFDKLPITLAEATENIKAAKEMWVTKFVRKTVNKGSFAPKRTEWTDSNYELSEAELRSMPMEVLKHLLGAGAYRPANRYVHAGRLCAVVDVQCDEDGPMNKIIKNIKAIKPQDPTDPAAAANSQEQRPRAIEPTM